MCGGQFDWLPDARSEKRVFVAEAGGLLIHTVRAFLVLNGDLNKE